MNAIILNGSPKKNIRESNSQLVAEAFVGGMDQAIEIRHIAGTDPSILAADMNEYDTILIVLPLYIHAMPGTVMTFLEHLNPASTPEKSIGFIVQAGFYETAQHRFLEPYLRSLAVNLNYRYLGYVAKGEAAGLYMFPKMYKKVLCMFSDLGKAFEQTGEFDPEIVEKLGQPYEICPKTLRVLKRVNKLGLTNIMWHSKLRKNGAMKQRLDKPFV